MDERIQEVISFLRSDDYYLTAEDPLDELSRSVNLSRSRLRHIFRVEAGMPWGRFVKSVRIERAMNLLTSSYLRVKEVCVKVGINDESQFVRDFRRAVGVTPARYRSCAASLKLQERAHLDITSRANK